MSTRGRLITCLSEACLHALFVLLQKRSLNLGIFHISLPRFAICTLICKHPQQLMLQNTVTSWCPLHSHPFEECEKITLLEKNLFVPHHIYLKCDWALPNTLDLVSSEGQLFLSKKLVEFLNKIKYMSLMSRLQVDRRLSEAHYIWEHAFCWKQMRFKIQNQLYFEGHCPHLSPLKDLGECIK